MFFILGARALASINTYSSSSASSLCPCMATEKEFLNCTSEVVLSSIQPPAPTRATGVTAHNMLLTTLHAAVGKRYEISSAELNSQDPPDLTCYS